MAYEQTSLGNMPLVLTAQRDVVPTSPPIPTHDWTAEALDAVRQRQGGGTTPSSTEGLPLWIQMRTAINRLAGNPLVWVSAGGILLIALYRRRMQQNPDLRIEYDPLADDSGDVYLGKEIIGEIVNLAPPGRRKEWQGSLRIGATSKPLPGSYPTAETAAAVVRDAWLARKVQSEQEAKQAIPEILSVATPDWVSGEIEAESFKGSVLGRYLVWIDDERAGFLDRRGDNWDAYVLVDDRGRTQRVAFGTTKKRAATSLYVATMILGELGASIEYGKGTKFVYLPKKQEIEIRRGAKSYVPRMDYEIANSTGIPLKEIRDIGRLLAEAQIIYGTMSRQQIRAFTKTEEVWQRPDQREEPPVGPKTQESYLRRRIVGTADIKKIRKAAKEAKKIREKGLMSEVGQRHLLPKAGGEIPRIRTAYEYKFSMRGPANQVGFFEFTMGTTKKKP